MYEVIPTKIFRAGSGILTYSSDLPLAPGHIVRIPLGRSHANGIVLRSVGSVDFPVKPIEKLLYPTPLPPHLLKSLLWLSNYYLTPLPSLASLILPIGIEKTRRKQRSLTVSAATSQAYEPASAERSSTGLRLTLRGNDLASTESPVTTGARGRGAAAVPLNSSQSAALAALRSAPSGTKLLHGITGSGKTNLYLHLATETLARGQSVILLVPEIALTSQLVQIFCSNLSQEITLIHSRQTESERHQIWTKLLTSDHPEVVIGPRSALFAPLKDLGLIIIDECHESSYFQDNTPRYSTLRLAGFISQTLHIDCILGSATPSVTDYHLAKSKHALVTLSEKAKQTAVTPNIHIIPLGTRQNFQKNRYFSDPLLKSIETNLQNHHQTLIFHNRRGSAPLTLCEKCGWQALCPTCYLPLTLHANSFELICHTCGFTTTLPHSCPSCGHPGIIHKGFGTKLLEAELTKLFKSAKIARFDADNKKQDSLDQLYDAVKSGDYQIIIGTQTIAKGLDLPNLATVGIVQADAGLSLPDFAAEERTFELLTQVIGRVGRGHLDTAEVFIQTYQPSHPAIVHAINADYPAFADYILKQRRAAHFPPFCYLARLTLSYKTESIAVQKIRQIHRQLTNSSNNEALRFTPKTKIILTPPTPAFHEQSSTGFTWQIIAKSPSRAALVAALKSLPAGLTANLKITLDPPSLL